MVDFGEILKAIGDFGLFQKLILLGLCLPHVLLPLLFASVLFVQSDPDRHCNTDWILRTGPNLTTDEQLNLTLPRELDGTFSRCLMFVPVDRDIDAIRDYGLNETTECQDGWVYDKALYEATIVTDFDLVCDKSNLAGIVQTVFMTGVLAGSLLFGPVAESYGRKRATQIPVVLLLIFSVVTGLSPSLYVYMASQFIVGAALSGYRINATVLATEWIGVSRRSIAPCLNQICMAIGQSLLAGLVYVIRDWRLAQYVMAGPYVLLFIYIWFIPESARWQYGCGRTREAQEVVLRVAAINKRRVPEGLLKEVTEEKQIQRGGIRVLFKSPVQVKHFIIITFAWFASSVGYFILFLNVGKFGLDIFLVQLLFGVTEIPGHLLCMWCLEVLGRKVSLTTTLLSSGLVCLLTLVFPQENAIAITALATTGKVLVNAASSVCMIYIQELFPTSVRQTAFGLGFIFYRIASLLAPLLSLLAVYHWFIPTGVFVSLSLVSGLLSFLLPETRRTELPESPGDEAEDNRNMTTVKDRIDSNLSDHRSLKSTKL